MRLHALVTALALTTAAPASAADAQTYVITGTGSYSHGVINTQSVNVVRFDGLATVVGTGGTGSSVCAFDGVEDASFLLSIGHWSGGCGTFRCIDWLVVRVAFVQQMTCSVGMAGDVPHSITCVWIPVDSNPTSRFTMVCDGNAVDVP